MSTLAELAARVSGSLTGDGSIEIARVTSTAEADGGALTFATDESYLREALASRAAAVLTSRELAAAAGESPVAVLAVDDVRLALASILTLFERRAPRGEFRHPSAVVASDATLGRNVYVGPHVCIGERARIGDDVTLEAAAIVAADASVGSGSILHQRATVLEGSVLGARCVIHTGAVIGSEGFGWAFEEGRLQKIPQVGNVVLGDDVEIGANTCVDRAQTGSTSIGNGTKIDNLCQIGHNCRIGEHTAMAAQCGLAGTTIIGSYTQIGGQAGFKGHIEIGSRAKIAAGSAVWGDVPDDGFVSGRPARPHKEELRREVMVRKLPKLFARVDALENSTHGDG